MKTGGHSSATAPAAEAHAPSLSQDAATATADAHAPSPSQDAEAPHGALLPAMERIDPFLRFLTKATGKASVPLKLLRQVLPPTNGDAAANQAEGGNDGDTGQESDNNGSLNEILLELTHRGVLNYQPEKDTVGFPLPPSPSNSSDASASQSSVRTDMNPPSKLVGKGLHGASEPAAKRRRKVLQWTLEKVPGWICRSDALGGGLAGKDGGRKPKAKGKRKRPAKTKNAEGMQDSDAGGNAADGGDGKQSTEVLMVEVDERQDECHERRDAYRALDDLLRGWNDSKDKCDAPNDGEGPDGQSAKHWLPCQAAHAGSHPGREARYQDLSEETKAKIPKEVLQLFHLDTGSSMDCRRKRLFLHQAKAIESAMNNVYTVVQTATGSGKSFCFLLPVLAKAMVSLRQCMQRGVSSLGSAAILLFPTKALAQDQYTKINSLLQSLPTNDGISLRVGVIDGDTPHSQRDAIASECQVILTNPDTLHAALLPNWKTRDAYKKLLARVTTVVVDEAHVYEGAFGAHVAMVLARLKRVCRVASSQSNSENMGAAGAINPLFIACSATMLHPEQHFRLLCPIGMEEEVCVLTATDDGSPCAPKHYFCWNPPILDVNGNSTESVFLPKRTSKEANEEGGAVEGGEDCGTGMCCHAPDEEAFVNIPIGSPKRKRKRSFRGDTTLHHHSNIIVRRRHAADETAFLLAKAVAAGVRTIAFCRTRMLVEWVYTKALEILQSDPKTSHLASKVESYRGGYTAEARRSIEERLFQRKLWGVVGTNALELGVDIGGVDLTLHCGYPGSISSLLQQSGRAGRGKGSEVPSCAIMVCFSSPSEQYIWKNPQTLLSKGVNVPPTLPINDTVMQGHLLCAGEEFPLVGDRPVTCLLNEFSSRGGCPADSELLGPADVYQDNVAFLLQKRLLSPKTANVVSGDSGAVESVVVHSTHPVVKYPWKRVSLRSIEPLSYSIVDLSHNLQGGKTDKVHDQAAVMDTIPYSRVFYHAFPGAIIMHRGRKYRIQSMESPPPFVGGASFGPSGCSNLLAFAKPTTLQYSTQALSINQITVVKQMGHAELIADNGGISEPLDEGEETREEKKDEPPTTVHSVASTVAGHGTVTVKRTVHGYKKLSHVNRKELSRTTISLPPMEFDAHALWIPVPDLRDVCFNFDGGVHALSHAMVAVAALFVPCSSSDVDCDHSRIDCTRILLYDQRAGGSGITAQLYNCVPDALQAAVDLLEDCTSCYSEKGYDGGCPACLQSVMCDNFHQDLSRTAGIHIGKYLIERLQGSTLKCRTIPEASDGRKLQSSKPKNIIIGRAGWMETKDRARWAEVDE